MRRFLLSAAKILVSAALLYFALRETNFTDLTARLDLESAGWLALALAIAVLQIFVGALRWRAVGADCGAPLSTTRAMRFNMIGSFFNQTLPSAIGGDAMRLWLVARAGAGWRAATYSVFVDRAIGLIALAMLILFTLPWSLNLIANPEGRLGLVLLDVAALGAGLVFLLLHLLPFELLTRIWATRHFYTCSQIASRILFRRGNGPMIAAISLLIHVLAVVIAWCVARAIAAPADFGQLLQLIPPVMLITMIPISIAGWGLREASMGLAFSYAGLGSSEGVNVSLLFGAVYFVVGAVGGLIWVVSAEKAAKGDAPIDVPE
ncbi:lysylphosphatidylglycerol synthase transmembrane domain-containing protein [Rhodopseudomonas palustris]|uniref:lysylphosphatidylglycerol synthase transmembrane domain-containing protein n=1 Tax=Rhodopseudomonas palustris TaxID=1076 RepID=UPI002ACE6252|nr:lysylphosphatidylglycerol synthase transmembrane domain-containing protein [Rhodopseudomonas palustris]WQH01923.1 lysylphosphatidylglycerol synthase transmembrane domain-containing protein [Rhodopseudomonas palustris]